MPQRRLKKGRSLDKRCPKKLKSLPCTACPEGRKAVDLARQGKEGGCPWFVADAESNFCFFKYMNDLGNKPVPPHRITHLLLVDDNEIKEIVTRFREAVNKDYEKV